MTKLESIKKHGVTAEGRRALMDYLKGRTLTLKEAVLARCYDCMSYYADGIADCKTQECPLYIYMPYRKVRRRRNPAVKKTAAKKAPAKKKPAQPAARAAKAPKAPAPGKPRKQQKAQGPKVVRPKAMRNKRLPKPLSLFG